MNAIVTDGHLRSAVAGLRGLGRGGVRVLVLGPARTAAGAWSRHAAGRATGPDSSSDPAGFTAAVARLAGEHGPAVVYPSCETAIDALAALGPGAEGMVLPYAGSRALGAVRDKRGLPALAAEVGLRAAAAQEATAAALSGEPPELPCVIKPARPGGSAAPARLVSSRRELDGLLARLPPESPLLVQEPLPGALIGLALVLARDGAVAARFQQRTLATYPREAGGTTSAVSVDPDEALVRPAAELLASAGYWGLAQLQVVAAPGGPVLIDINPRFYGSLPLALACGVNLPAAWHAVATDGPAPAAGPYPAGVRYRWLEGDLLAALRGSAAGLLRREPRPRAGAMWAAEDPMPSVLLAAGAVTGRVRRRLLARMGR